MVRPAIDVNGIEQDNAPRLAYNSDALIAYNATGVLNPARYIYDSAVETVVVVHAKNRIGKLRDLNTGKSEAAANVLDFDMKRVSLKQGQELFDLARTLKSLDPQHEAIIPGDMITSKPGMYGPRRLISKEDGNATIRDYASRIVHLDLDKLSVPTGFDYHSKRDLADVVKASLPPFAQSALIMIGATSSHGYNIGTTGARAALMLDRAMTLKQKKFLFGPWCKSAQFPDAKIDRQLFNPNQLIFVGAAFHLDGIRAVDPYADLRFYFDNREGGDVVVTDEMFESTYETVVEIVTDASGKTAPREVKRVRDVDFDDEVPLYPTLAAAVETIANTDDLKGESAHFQTVGAARAAYRENPYADIPSVEAAIRKALQVRFDNAKTAGHPRGAGEVADRLNDVSRQVRDAERDYGRPRRKLGSRPMPAPTMTADEALEALSPHLQRVFDAGVARSKWHATPLMDRDKAMVPHAPRIVSKVTTGVGKSALAVRKIVDEVLKARAEGRMFRILYGCPNHALGREIVDLLKASGVKVTRYISPHYNGAEHGDPTCHHPGLVAMFQAPFGTIAESCGECPLLRRCAIGLQDHSQSEVVILCGPVLMSPIPPSLRRADFKKNEFKHLVYEKDDDGTPIAIDGYETVVDSHFDMVIIDEAPLASWTQEFEATVGNLLWTGDGFDAASVFVGDSETSLIKADQLMGRIDAFVETTAQVRAVIADMMETLAEEGIAPDDAATTTFGPGRWNAIERAAYDILERPDADIAHSIHRSGGEDPGSRYRGMVELATAARAWLNLARCMLPSFTDGARGVVRFGERDSDGKVGVKMEWRGEVHSDHRGVPLLVLDATASEYLTARFLPGAEFVDIAAKDGSLVCRRLWNEDTTDGALSHKDRLRRLLDGIATLPGGHKGLVTTKKAIATATNFMPEMLEPFTVSQYADLRGLNSQKGCDHLALLGRQFAPFDAVRETAIRIFGRDIAEKEGFHLDPTREKAPILLRNGSVVFLDAYWHPLQEIRAVMTMIRDDEIVQGDGRLRACRRSDRATLDHFTSGATLNVIYDEVGLSLAHKGSISEVILALAKTGFAASHRRAWAKAAGLTEEQVRLWSIRETIMGMSGSDFLTEVWTNAVSAEVPMVIASIGKLRIAGTDLTALSPKQVYPLEARMVGSVKIVI